MSHQHGFSDTAPTCPDSSCHYVPDLSQIFFPKPLGISCLTVPEANRARVPIPGRLTTPHRISCTSSQSLRQSRLECLMSSLRRWMTISSVVVGCRPRGGGLTYQTPPGRRYATSGGKSSAGHSPNAPANISLLWMQCMNRLHQVGVTGERLPRGSIIGSQPLANLVWLGVHIEELPPCQVVFQVTPPPLDRAQLRTVGW